MNSELLFVTLLVPRENVLPYPRTLKPYALSCQTDIGFAMTSTRISIAILLIGLLAGVSTTF
jgi:hypothetical protein